MKLFQPRQLRANFPQTTYRPNMDDNSLQNQAIKVSVVLTCKDDWRRWYEAIETTADLAGIWEYINPDIIPKPEVP
jgi:hypothetical protein